MSATFDDDTLLPNGGLVVAGLLAQRLGVAELVDERVTLDGPGRANAGVKALTVIGSALAGGDFVGDVDVLRAGATGRVFDEVRTPSTVGTGLRAYQWANVRQLDSVTRELPARAWAAGLGPDPDADRPWTSTAPCARSSRYGSSRRASAQRLRRLPDLAAAQLHRRLDPPWWS